MAVHRTAQKQLQTSERLDRVLSVTPARAWVGLIAIIVATVSVSVWSVVGEVSTYVDAHGLLLNEGGRVVDAVATGSGRLNSIIVTVGDEIEQGDLIGLIANDEVSARHASAVALVEERMHALDGLTAAIAEESRIVRANHARNAEQLAEIQATAGEMLELSRANLESTQRLFEQNLLSRVTLEQNRQEFNDTRRILFELNSEQRALEVEMVRYENDNGIRIREMTEQVEAAKRQLTQIEAQLAAEKILSPVSGQVIEIKGTTGAAVSPGLAVASIRTGTARLEVLLYVPPTDGKQVEAGMQALVSPATVRREEFGTIRGTVEFVSPFPATLEGMVAVLQNRNLALSFSEDGPPYAGRVVLTPDPTTASGFEWTSPRAADQTLTAGTLASVQVKTRGQAPITLAIPLLRELVGL